MSAEEDDGNVELKCKYCFKAFDGFGHNPINLQRHEEACQLNPKRKRKVKHAHSHSITKFFKSQSQPQPTNDDDIDDMDNADVTGEHPPLLEQSASTSTEETHPPAPQSASTSTEEPHPPALDDDELTLVETGQQLQIPRKCNGYVPPLVGSIWENFPFQLLDTDTAPLKDVVFENGVFHSKNCFENMYLLPMTLPDVHVTTQHNNNNNTHPDCSNLVNHEALTNYVNNACDADKHLSTCQNKYLNHNQLCKRVTHLRSSLNSTKLKSLNRERKLVNVNKSLDLHQRFILHIKENDIPKLHELVKVACNRNRGLEYTINKIVDAIDSVYNPRSSEDDKDLAFLIQQYGGPGLLDIVHRALNFPSTSTAYRMLQDSRKFINSSVNTDVELFVDNIEVSPTAPKYGYMLKVDESYFEAKVRWNPSDNKIYGICYEHGRLEDLTFDSYDHVEMLAEKVQEGELHVPKENMVVAVSNNSAGVESNAQVVAALPTCSKNEINYQSELIDEVSNQFFRKHSAPLMNWSTDGDATRRILFDDLMCHDLSPTSPIYDTIKDLSLLDTKVGRHDETVNFDHKHLVKRLRKCLINDNFKIGNRVILKSDMEKIISLVPNNSPYSNKQLLNVGDKMNVPLATAFLLQFCEAVEDVEQLKTVNMRVSDVAEELHLLKFVIEGVLAGYSNPNTTIQTQLEKMSLGAHILFVLQRELKSFLSNQLYHDIQCTFMDAFYCAAKYKEYHPDEPLFIMLCANDVLERYFGNVRLKYKHSIVDNLELIFATRAIQLCGEMMVKHPDWFAKNRSVMQRLCLDYSSPKVWNLEKLTLRDVDIISTWNVGRASAEVKLRSCKCEGKCSCRYKSKCNFTTIARQGHTLLIPNGTKLGLNPREKDFSLEDDSAVEVENQNDVQEVDADGDAEPMHGGDVEDTPATSLIDMIPFPHPQENQKHDVQIEIDNKYVYKATVVKSIFSSQPLSRDRLRRVRGMTKYTESTAEGEHSIETSVLAGDPIMIEVKGILRIAQIQLLKRANRKVKLIQAEDIHNENVYVEATLMKMELHDNVYYWSGGYGAKVTALGTACHAIQPSLMEIEGKMRFTFDKQFIIDFNVGMTLEAQRTGATDASNSVVVSDSVVPSSSNSATSSSSQSTSGGKGKTTNSKDEKLKLMISCFICKVKLELGQMRKHVGVHIHKGTLSGCNICGFCGRDVCTNTLVASAKNSSKQYFRISTNCKYDSFIQRKPVFSRRNVCTNHLVQCSVCKAAIWTYNAKSHYEAVHEGVEYEDAQFVVAQERAAMNDLARKCKQ